jgi:pimeloyl-ACP methyl ester carboxylesterase
VTELEYELSTGGRLSYSEAGVGRPLLLLHGVLASRHFFNRNIEPLSEHFHVFAVDLRGHGDSTETHGGNTIPQLARDIHAFMVDNQLHDVVAIGWSMGNLVIWDYLTQFKAESRISAQVCISQGPSDLNADGWGLGFTDRPGLRDLLRMTQDDYRGVCAYVATIMTEELPSAEDQQWMIDEQMKTSPNTATCILADQTQRDYRAVLPGLGLPVLAVWGRDEKCLPVAAGEWLAATMPNIELEIFEHSGHMPMWEEPERLNRLITGWIHRLPTRPSP